MTKKDTGPQQEPERNFEQTELSETWRELLGKRFAAQQQAEAGKHPRDGKGTEHTGDAETSENAGIEHEEDGGAPQGAQTIPTLKSDPWSTLIQSKGVEIVDLNQAHLPISDQDVEQILKLMQEYPDQSDEGASFLKQRRRPDHEES